LQHHINDFMSVYLFHDATLPSRREQIQSSHAKRLTWIKLWGVEVPLNGRGGLIVCPT
jgi:hypothetical protein